MRLDGGLLLIFRALVRQGQTTAAADELGLSQSAVSHALGRLRDLFGDPLFLRRAHGLEPTARALALAPRIDAIIAMMAATVAQTEPFDPALSRRRFVLASEGSLIDTYGAEFIARLGRKAPQARVALKVLLGEMALDAVRRGEVDLAIGVMPKARGDLLIEPVYEERYVLVVHPGHRLASGRITFADYLSEKHIWAQPPLEAGANVGPLPSDRHILAVVPSFLSALMLAASTDAVATVPSRFGLLLARRLGLVARAPKFLNETLLVSLARRNGGYDTGCDWFAGETRAILRSSAARPARKPIQD